MAVCGVYKDLGANAPDVDVLSLHLNLWMLPKRPFADLLSIALDRSFYRYYIDVGLRLKVASSTFSSIDLLLPCEPVSDTFIDLNTVVLDERVNDLLFGRPVDTANGRIRFRRYDEDYDDAVCGIRRFERIPGFGQRYRIYLTSSIKVDGDPETIYCRFRFRSQDASDLLVSKGWGLAKRGFICDLRINDVRETIGLDRSIDVLHPVSESNCFIICPSSYVPIVESPRFHYSRILEAGAWEEYLKSCMPFNTGRKFVIYQWRGLRIDYLTPFRSYVHLHKEFGLSILIVYILGLMTGPIAGIVVKLIL